MPFPYPKIIDDRPPSDIIIARLIVGKRHCRVLIPPHQAKIPVTIK
ncbi:hypothetical protein [Microcoleus sp. LAD1_D3]